MAERGVQLVAQRAKETYPSPPYMSTTELSHMKACLVHIVPTNPVTAKFLNLSRDCSFTALNRAQVDGCMEVS